MASANLFLSDVSAESLRHAVIEDDGEVAYLYLTESAKPNIVAYAWIYSRADLPDPSKHNWSILWNRNGDSVAVLADGRPIACIIGAVGPGYSRGLKAASSLGHVWDDMKFSQVFGRV